MGTYTIHDKLAVTSINPSVDEFPVWQGSAQKKATVNQIVASAFTTAIMSTRGEIVAATVPAAIQAIRTSGYAGVGDGGSALYKRVGSAPSHPGKVQSTDGAWWEIIAERGVIDPKQLGAVANGTTDDSTAMVAAEATAYALGVALFFSTAVYTYNGVFTVRVSIYSVGGTIKQQSTTINPSTYHDCTLYIHNVANLIVQGLTVDSISMARGIIADGATNFVLRDCTSIHGMGSGIAVVNCAHGVVDRCNSLYTAFTYGTYPMVGGDGDGFYCGQSNDITFFKCYAYDFTRIGFVSEGIGSGDANSSNNINLLYCTAEYAHDQHTYSTTEYNGGIWMEHTRSGCIIGCSLINIDSGVGQLSGNLTRGIIIDSNYSDNIHDFSIKDCVILANGTLGFGLTIGVTSLNGRMLVDHVRFSNCHSPIELQGDADTITLRNIIVEGMVAGGGFAFGATIVPGSAGLNFNNLIIDNVRYFNCTGDCHIMNFSPGFNGNIRIMNTVSPYGSVFGNQVTSITVDNCDLTINSTSGSDFIADNVFINNSIIRLVTGGHAYLFTANFSTATSIRVSNSLFTTTSTPFASQIGGINKTIRFDNCTFDGVGLTIQTTGSSSNKFRGCDFINYETSVGYALGVGFGSFTRHEFIVDSCRFVGATVDGTPITQQNTALPTYTILANNTYNTTLLIDYSTRVTNTAPVQTL